jgi:hypothetical protein
MGFEPTIVVLESENILCALHGTTNGTGTKLKYTKIVAQKKLQNSSCSGSFINLTCRTTTRTVEAACVIACNKSSNETGTCYVGYKVLTALAMTSTVWDITQLSPVKAKRRFGRICRLHLQGLRVSQARK